MSGHGRPLRVLHVGTGFRPWRRGGLVAYVEDLIGAQAAAGHRVAYLFAGRYYPFTGGPRVRRWRRGPVEMLEIVNSPLYDHGRQPEQEISEPRVERIVRDAIGELDPDVVHVQELAGLPSSVLEIPRERGVPVVLTLQDYFALCPTFKLLDAEGQTFLSREVGRECVASVAAEPRDPALLLEATLRHDLGNARLLRPLGRHRLRVQRGLLRWGTRLGRHGLPPRVGGADPEAAFQRRRDVNVERVGRVDRVLAMSSRVAELHTLLGVDPAHMEVMQLTLSHIEHLRPRRRTAGAPVTFATLGGAESPAKGSEILLAAARSLAGAHGARVLVFGHPEPAFRRAAAGVEGLEVRPAFRPDQLDDMLDEVDVGIMPSVWEEAYGFAGMEFLAKGIPVVGNAVGGITDYVADGETGWLNEDLSAAGLARIMRRLAERTEEVDAMADRVRRRREKLVLPMSRHANELEAVYRAEIARA